MQHCNGRCRLPAPCWRLLPTHLAELLANGRRRDEWRCNGWMLWNQGWTCTSQSAFPCVEYRTRSLQLAQSMLLHASHILLASCTFAGRHLDGAEKGGTNLPVQDSWNLMIQRRGSESSLPLVREKPPSFEQTQLLADDGGSSKIKLSASVDRTRPEVV